MNKLERRRRQDPERRGLRRGFGPTAARLDQQGWLDAGAPGSRSSFSHFETDYLGPSRSRGAARRRTHRHCASLPLDPAEVAHPLA